MTCRGYTPAAVKISRAIKTMSLSYLNPHERGAFIRAYVKVLEENTKGSGRRPAK